MHLSMKLFDMFDQSPPHTLDKISDHMFIICHVGSRLGLRGLPRLGLCGPSFKVRTIQFLYRPILSSLKNLYKNNYPKDTDL